MKRNILIAAIVLGAVLIPRGGYTSGSTIVTRTGKYYSISLHTPRKVFRSVPPEEGLSGGPNQEERYHAEANAKFTKLLKEYEPKTRAHVERLFEDFSEKAKLVAYQPGYFLLHESRLSQPERGGSPPYRMSFMIFYPDMGTLELAFGEAPSPEIHQAIGERIKALFAPAS